MKPHMNRRHGIWACFTRCPRAIGCGYSPREAYAEWQRHFSSLRSQQA